MDGGGAVRGDGDLHGKPVAFALPVADDSSIRGVVMRPDPFDVTDGLGLDDDTFESGGRRIGLNARQALVEPITLLLSSDIAFWTEAASRRRE